MDDKIKKNPKKSKKDDGSTALFKKFGGKLRELMGEFRKIIWPDRKALVKHTVNTIIISGLIGGVIVVMDLALSQGYSQFIKLIP